MKKGLVLLWIIGGMSPVFSKNIPTLENAFDDEKLEYVSFPLSASSDDDDFPPNPYDDAFSEDEDLENAIPLVASVDEETEIQKNEKLTAFFCNNIEAMEKEISHLQNLANQNVFVQNFFIYARWSSATTIAYETLFTTQTNGAHKAGLPLFYRQLIDPDCATLNNPATLVAYQQDFLSIPHIQNILTAKIQNDLAIVLKDTDQQDKSPFLAGQIVELWILQDLLAIFRSSLQETLLRQNLCVYPQPCLNVARNQWA